MEKKLGEFRTTAKVYRTTKHRGSSTTDINSLVKLAIVYRLNAAAELASKDLVRQELLNLIVLHSTHCAVSWSHVYHTDLPRGNDWKLSIL